MADANTTTYICSKCKLEQPPENFYRNGGTTTGRDSRCKRCKARDQSARWWAKKALRPPKPFIPEGYKKCPRCDEVKIISSFGADSRRPSGLKCWCKDCHTEDGRDRWKNNAELRAKVGARNKDWMQRHPEKYAEYTGRWRKLNPDAASAVFHAYRARKKSAEGRYTAEDIQAIHVMQKGKCAYCKRRLGGSYQVDHIKPLARGGSNLRANLQLTCRSCNARKHAHDPIDYARQLGRLL
jgi:5-methylcytosine-specific restriction endonuclease McrA/DNA-directed RNA polymerase subunit RPC12/RpoP